MQRELISIHSKEESDNLASWLKFGNGVETMQLWIGMTGIVIDGDTDETVRECDMHFFP